MNFKLEWKKIIICFIAVSGMGFFLSFLILCNLGTDPCTFMNRSIAAKVGLSFGNMQFIANLVMFIIVLIFSRKLIGIGTFFNMVLIGYYADFFCWLWKKILPQNTFTNSLSRWIIFFIAIFAFIICAAVYINTNTGVAPYDGLPIIISDKIRNKFASFPKTLVRMIWDALVIVVGILMGSTPVIGIILMAVFLGPAITFVGKIFGKN